MNDAKKNKISPLQRSAAEHFCSVSTHYTVAALRLPVCPTALLGTGTTGMNRCFMNQTNNSTLCYCHRVHEHMLTREGEG